MQVDTDTSNKKYFAFRCISSAKKLLTIFIFTNQALHKIEDIRHFATLRCTKSILLS